MPPKNRADFMFCDKKGEVLVKAPGSINGNGFVVERLVDCEVYVLDHSSQVQIDDCINCKIIIGPCDGSVFIRDSKGCFVAAASRQLRTRDCEDIELSLYCCTQPSIETSKGLTFTCWRVAYPNLTAHFEAANLDPGQNTWDKIFNFNSEDEVYGKDSYVVDYSEKPTIEALPEGVEGTCENPVALAAGAKYDEQEEDGAGDAEEDSLPDAAEAEPEMEAEVEPETQAEVDTWGQTTQGASDDCFAAFPAEADVVEFEDEGEDSSAQAPLQGAWSDAEPPAFSAGPLASNASGVFTEEAAPAVVHSPKASLLGQQAFQEASQPLAAPLVVAATKEVPGATSQLAQRAAAEQELRTHIRSAAKQYLDKLQEERTKLVQNRRLAHREAEACSPTAFKAAKGHPWESITALIDFKATTASDVSRLRSVLLFRKALEQKAVQAACTFSLD